MIREVEPTVVPSGEGRESSATRKTKREAAASKPPKETTHGLLYIFPFLCRVREDEASSTWKLQVIEIPAETLNEARFVLEEDPDVKIVSVSTGRPHWDCLKDCQIFDLQKAAAYSGLEYSTMSKKVSSGELPKAANGDPRFTLRRILNLFRAKGERDE